MVCDTHLGVKNLEERGKPNRLPKAFLLKGLSFLR